MISVIIPTYNRAHLLGFTLPKYLNSLVSELLVIDDGSTDDTQAIVEVLIQQYPKIKYFRNQQNLGSVMTRNKGLELAAGDYIFIGDDDAYPDKKLYENLINALLDHKSDVAAAREVYLKEDADEQGASITCNDLPPVNFNKLSFYFNTNWSGYVATSTPFMLIKKEVASRLRYDEFYQGSAWREETDFSLSAHSFGYVIYFCSAAKMYHLPKLENKGGQWERSWWYYEYSAVKNNWHFLNKHYCFMVEKCGVTRSKIYLQGLFVCQRIKGRSVIVLKKLLGPKIVLKLRKCLARIN